MKKLMIFLLTLVLISSCQRFNNADKKANHAERIVLISKQYTEIIHALGAEKDVVAVDLSSIYPEKVKKLPTVGYHRALSIEGLLAAKPTLIMHDGINSLGPDHIVKQIMDLEIPMKTFHTKAKDVASTKALIHEIANYFHKEAAADSLCKILDNQINEARKNATKFTEKPRVLVVHFGRASNVYLVMSNGGAVGKMIAWAGAEMAVPDTSGMQHLSAEIISEYNPDVILLTDYGYDRLGSDEKIKELPGISSTAAALNNRIYRVNECDMVYLGPRSGAITLALQKLIHQR
ncbi:ABC transporter substrate-binding protein [Putridiphycobacter roseus]|uniref:ABC transporter substrate-binding protein n=1 Tax=Putridiphycobacter roseus TaxID=2219161 RepID=A0A2W1NSU1_9FLAO|nr:ABC transporter substrate-binding protein [Putridiphycobacter roseus]PZE18712.1 ABC transporter substrate-binding protein [Putridiphycobacter roseus]